MDQPQDPEITTEEFLGWMEFGCWSALVMAPLIYWLQGPSVSTDQFVVRTALVILAAVGGVGLRIRVLLQRRRVGRNGANTASPAPPTSAEAPPQA
jgi:hypothetical protein